MNDLINLIPIKEKQYYLTLLTTFIDDFFQYFMNNIKQIASETACLSLIRIYLSLMCKNFQFINFRYLLKNRIF